jgi:hypothetical protein
MGSNPILCHRTQQMQTRLLTSYYRVLFFSNVWLDEEGFLTFAYYFLSEILWKALLIY